MEEEKKSGYTYTQSYHISDRCMETMCGVGSKALDIVGAVVGKMIDLESVRTDRTLAAKELDRINADYEKALEKMKRSFEEQIRALEKQVDHYRDMK